MRLLTSLPTYNGNLSRRHYSKPTPEPASLETVLSRITTVEDTLRKLIPMVPNANALLASLASVTPAPLRIEANGASDGRGTNGDNAKSSIRSSFGSGTKEEEVAMMLEVRLEPSRR